MKFYYIDKLLWLLAMIGGILFGIYILRQEILIFWILFYGFLVGFGAKELLLLLIDILLGERGKEEKVLYFWRDLRYINLDFFPKKMTSIWCFIYSEKGKNYKVELIMPIALEEKDIERIDRPQIHDKVRVTYYKWSKIICSWEKI